MSPICSRPASCRFLIVRPSVGHVPNAGRGPRRAGGGSTKTGRHSGSATRPSPDTTEKPRPVHPARPHSLILSPMRQRIASIEVFAGGFLPVDVGAALGRRAQLHGGHDVQHAVDLTDPAAGQPVAHVLTGDGRSAPAVAPVAAMLERSAPVSTPSPLAARWGIPETPTATNAVHCRDAGRRAT